MTKYAIIGCRTSRERGARGRGVSIFRIRNNGDWQFIATQVGVQENPSWIYADDKTLQVFVVYGDGDLMSRYLFDKKYEILLLQGSMTTGSRHSNPEQEDYRRNNPVHIAMSPNRDFLMVANHESGNIAVYSEAKTLGSTPPDSFVHFPGRKDSSLSVSRPHQIIFDRTGQYIFVPVQGRKRGNGINSIDLFSIWNGELKRESNCQLPDGSWPRHVCANPYNDVVYLLNELSCHIDVFCFDRELKQLHLIDSVRSLPEVHEAKFDAAEIVISLDGRYIYTTNRIHNSISIFSVDVSGKEVVFLKSISCGGKTPRFACLSPFGMYFYCANEDSDTIVEFEVDPISGSLQSTGQVIDCASPTCIAFLETSSYDEKFSE